MKKIKFLLTIGAVFLGFTLLESPVSASVNSDLSNGLNSYAQSNDDSDFKKATVKGKTITVTVDDSYVEDPVEDAGREAYLTDTFKQVKKIQKEHGTKYKLIVKDKESGKIAQVNFKGKGWVRSTFGKTDKDEYDFN